MNNRTSKSGGWGILTVAAAVVLVAVFAGIAAREFFVQRSLSERSPGPGTDMTGIPEELLAFEELQGSFRVGHRNVVDFSVDSCGRIHVAGDRSVRIYENNGALSDEIFLPGVPTAVTASEDKLYVALKNHLAIYSREGELLERWEPPSENSLITSIAVHEGGVFLADAGSRTVRHYDNDGHSLAQIGARDAERGVPGIVLPGPYFVVVMGWDGLLRVNNPGRHRIEVYSPEGELERYWGKPSSAIEGFCGCCNPVDFDLLPDGRYVTAEKGLIRVKMYDADGHLESVVAGPDDLAPGSLQLLGQRSPDRGPANFKVAAGNDGLIHVLDTRENRVRFFREKDNEQSGQEG